jgi:hypothetical protein
VTAFLRRAGSGRLADGAGLTWSVADGRRGRRWRAVTTMDGVVTHALLLEVDSKGRLARLELTTAAGLLTLHPEPDGATLHGNVVTADGVRHLAFPWSHEHGLSIVGRPIADAVTAHRLADSCGVGEGRLVETRSIGPDLAITRASVRFERMAEDTWRIVDPAGTRTLLLDSRGVPAGLVGSAEWPLELD